VLIPVGTYFSLIISCDCFIKSYINDNAKVRQGRLTSVKKTSKWKSVS
jgi:hypothetical protein